MPSTMTVDAFAGAKRQARPENRCLWVLQALHPMEARLTEPAHGEERLLLHHEDHLRANQPHNWLDPWPAR